MRIILVTSVALVGFACGGEDDDDDEVGGLDAGADAGGEEEGDDAGAPDAAADAGHEGLVPYGDEWLTPEEMEARRAEEREEIGWDFESKTACDAFVIYSTATPEQVAETCTVAAGVYDAWVGFFAADHELLEDPEPMLVRLFGTRDEFRDVVLDGEGWAEGLYDGYFCNMYWDGDAANPYHWFIHEATHQLNWELGRMNNVQWLEEGIACYFGTSFWREGELALGDPDPDTYPVWWLSEWDLGTQLIPLETIVAGEGGPSMDEYFNYYYLEWWTLVHYLVHGQGGANLGALHEMIDDPGLDVPAFEALVGDVGELETGWRDWVESM
jgi:hypothetical protein